MANHGYKRMTGYTAFSCLATGSFKPLEVSCDGLRRLLRGERRAQRHDKKQLAEKESWSVICEGRVPNVTWIHAANSGWELAVERQARRLRENIKTRGREIKRLVQRLKEWEPPPLRMVAERYEGEAPAPMPCSDRLTARGGGVKG